MCNLDLNTSNDCRKCYIFDDISYYKVMSRKATYYIKVSDYHKISLRQTAVTLYEYTRNGLIQIKSYIKSMEFSDILFIAAPTIANNFKMYDLEKS